MLRRALHRYGGAAAVCIPRSRLHGSVAVSSEVLASQEQAAEAPKKKLGWSVIFLFLPCVATFGLGTWQVYRRQWKADLLDYKRKRLEQDPVPLSDALENSDPDALEYRRIVCEGVYDEEKSIFIGPRMKNLYGASQRGYYIVTPLYPASGSPLDVQTPVLVNRGWVPFAWRQDFEKGIVAPKLSEKQLQQDQIRTGTWWKKWKRQPSVQVAQESSGQGTVRVCGVVRNGETPNMFVPLNVPEKGQWFYFEVPAMLKATGLPENSPYIEAVEENTDESDQISFPVPKELEDFVRTSLMPNDHLTYAATWYTLSAATTYMAWKRIHEKPVGRKKLR